MIKTFKMLLFAILLATAAPASANSFRLKTAKAVGDKLSIAINAGIQLTLTWSDGTVEETTSTGELQTVVVKSETLTISSTGDITSIYVADNELTELNVNAASPTLRRLYCANNQLSSLNLGNCTALVSLDCQGNKISTLNIASTIVEDLNVADNNLSSHGLHGGSSVTSMVCANNKITSINYLPDMAGLVSLFCQGNQIAAVNVTGCTNLQQVLASDNRLTTFDAKPLTQLQQLWIGNNRLKTVNLSDNKVLVGLVVPDNELTEILWNRDCRDTFKYFDFSNNGLFFNSFPVIYNTLQQKYTIDGAIGTQKPFALLGNIDVNTRSESLETYLYQNGWNTSTQLTLTLTDANGTTLESGTDYSYANWRFRFLTAPWNQVVIKATSKSYPDVELYSTPFSVIDPAGISLVTDTQTPQTVYNLQGRRVNPNSSLPKGIYIVDGKKVVVR